MVAPSMCPHRTDDPKADDLPRMWHDLSARHAGGDVVATRGGGRDRDIQLPELAPHPRGHADAQMIGPGAWATREGGRAVAARRTRSTGDHARLQRRRRDVYDVPALARCTTLLSVRSSELPEYPGSTSTC